MTEDEETKMHRFGMTQGALYAFAGLALFFCMLAAFNIYLWNHGRSADAELRAEKQARLSQRAQDERSAAVLKVSQCRQSIAAIRIANTVIEDQRADHVARANQADALASADPTPALARVHRAIAKQQRRKADLLTDFPMITQKDCDKLAAKLLGAEWRKIPGTLPQPPPKRKPGPES